MTEEYEDNEVYEPYETSFQEIISELEQKYFEKQKYFFDCDSDEEEEENVDEESSFKPNELYLMKMEDEAERKREREEDEFEILLEITQEKHKALYFDDINRELMEYFYHPSRVCLFF
jgi:hypothetical protein